MPADSAPYVAHRNALTRYLEVRDQASLLDDLRPLTHAPRQASAKLQCALWHEIRELEGPAARLSVAVWRYWRTGDDPTGQVSLLSSSMREAFDLQARLKLMRDAFVKSTTTFGDGHIKVTFEHELSTPAGPALAEFNMLIVSHSIASAFPEVVGTAEFAFVGNDDGSVDRHCEWMKNQCTYGATWPSVRFPMASLGQLNPHADADTLGYYVRSLERDAELLRAQVGSVNERVSAFVDAELHRGVPTHERIAAYCGLSVDELHNALQSEGQIELTSLISSLQMRALRLAMSDPNIAQEQWLAEAGVSHKDQLPLIDEAHADNPLVEELAAQIGSTDEYPTVPPSRR